MQEGAGAWGSMALHPMHPFRGTPKGVHGMQEGGGSLPQPQPVPTTTRSAKHRTPVRPVRSSEARPPTVHPLHPFRGAWDARGGSKDMSQAVLEPTALKTKSSYLIT
ncbi:hypothetical protein COCOBI_pt-0040 (chloroplast) [Coccomyxa sp. Obi]|nr:hypothetical protein COCOBI_pt-0040 [Coccomyxa sp. Obi]